MVNTRQGIRSGSDPGIGRTLLGSLGLHLLIIFFFAGSLLPRFEEERRPVYYVDLANLPVKAPRAGRPDAPPIKPATPVKPAPLPAKAPPPPVKTRTEPVKVSPPAAKTTPPAKATAPAARTTKADDSPSSAIDDMRRKKEIADLKATLAALADDRRARAPDDAPVGMPDGRGSESGVSYDAWVQSAYKQAWTLSRYQVGRLDLEAKVRVTFDAEGNLRDYKIDAESGDARFDDSVKSAILQIKKLPTAPGERLELEVVFNLKDLLKD
ncbi:TonB C-terminal domain-containing protein [Desulfuromonas soudanensis]|nr:TonB C-terminal domain-containing protein [Desulfuromonas soudanensis]